jgi:hypothetical protein
MIEFNKKIQAKFAEMCKTGKLFRVELTGQQVWDLYLSSFSKENNPIFRDPQSTSKNCNHCNNFVRRYGNIVAIDEQYGIVTMFDVDADDEFKETVEILSKAIKDSKVTEVFFETFNELNGLPYESCSKTHSQFQLGVSSNPKRYTREEAEKFGVVKPNEVRLFNHLHLFLSKEFVDQSGNSIEAIMGGYRDAKNVFQRAMETISLDTLKLVKDLINQGSLLDGATHLYKIEQIIPLKQEYDDLPINQRNNWCWVKSFKLPFAKFKNELIGVLCSELSEGEELNKACQSWNKRVDPANYMKVTAPITKRQIEEAKTFVEENGYTESFSRRFATIDDIKVSEILHSNVGEGKVKAVSIFDGVKSTSTRHKRSEFEGVEVVGIDKFMKDILPSCSAIEAFLSNSHQGNLVSLTTANKEDSKPIFKWSNNYSWTFNGNLAGKSQIKEAVKTAGGRVDGVLRFSMIWNDSDGKDNSDLDAWCQQPDKERIGYSTGYRSDRGNHFTSCSGQLDLDNTMPSGKLAIENIYFADLKRMKDGVYFFWVNQYSSRNSQGFKAEIEFNGEMYSYEYNKPVSGNIKVAEVTLKNGQFSINHLTPESAVSSKEIYGLESNQFHKVNLMCLSPNHWNGESIGNKHYFFMLEGCKSPTSIRSFHNENLLPELAQHRKVLEVLGATNMIEPSEKQLSGLGFNATVRDELIVRLQGTHKRVIKIKF